MSHRWRTPKHTRRREVNGESMLEEKVHLHMATWADIFVPLATHFVGGFWYSLCRYTHLFVAYCVIVHEVNCSWALPRNVALSVIHICTVGTSRFAFIIYHHLVSVTCHRADVFRVPSIDTAVAAIIHLHYAEASLPLRRKASNPPPQQSPNIGLKVASLPNASESVPASQA